MSPERPKGGRHEKIADAAKEVAMILREEHIEEDGGCFACEVEWPCVYGILIEAVDAP